MRVRSILNEGLPSPVLAFLSRLVRMAAGAVTVVGNAAGRVEAGEDAAEFQFPAIDGARLGFALGVKSRPSRGHPSLSSSGFGLSTLPAGRTPGALFFLFAFSMPRSAAIFVINS